MTHTGFFERYFITPFIRRYTDFKGSESRKSALISLAAWFIITLGIAGVLLGQVGLLGPEVGFLCIDIFGTIWIVGSIIPMAALVARVRNHGDEDANPRPIRMLGIDKMLMVCCFLFFILGILMAVTTLNSGAINPYYRGQGDRKGNPILEQEEVYEEPIFNYQAEDPAPVEEIEEEEVTAAPSDSIILDESFDPTIETQVELDTISLN